MDVKTAFNSAICFITIPVLLIHIVNLFLKKEKRRDEKYLLVFFIFTAIHFAVYLTFTLLKHTFASDELVLGFYSSFYMMNNTESLLFFAFAIVFLSRKDEVAEVVTIVNVVLYLAFIVLDVINIFNPIFFYVEKATYTRLPTMVVSQIYQFITLVTILVLTIVNKKINRTERVAFIIYCILPAVAVIAQDLVSGYAIGYLSIVIAIEVLFLFVNIQKSVDLANEAKRNKEAEIKIMMSQIQPHFIYNTLSSISTLIPIDPDKAQDALDRFTEYLRTNLSALSDTGLILFNEELKHIKTYLSLEKLRFNERLNVVYDIKSDDFLVPPLSLQPLVENAVKHGILKNLEGGTVTIRTYENSDAFVVEVIDDGVGFDVSKYTSGGSKHIGLQNVKSRIVSMVRGDMQVESEIGKGTKITVALYK
ncbi:MAG: histidine kinase [Bacilli bacterium]|nr:histidine kinase [Bacilli bacterium]